MEEQIRAIADEAGGVCWEVCTGDICIRDRNRQQLNRRLAALQSLQTSEMRLAALQGTQGPPPNQVTEQPTL
jgi:hypothetical protein